MEKLRMYHGAVTQKPQSDLGSDRGATPNRRCAGLAVWALTAVLACRFYWVVSHYAVNLFFMDEWDVYAGLFQGWPWWRFFLQEHGPHRQGAGVSVVVGLLRASHWDSRMQAYVIAAAIVLAGVLAIWLKTKSVGPLAFFDAIVPIMFLGLGQWEVLLSAPGPSAQAFPLILLIVYCLAWVLRTEWLRYFGICLFNFLLVYTGYGIFVAPITLTLLAIDCWQRRTIRQALIAPLLAWMGSAASLVLFFYEYKFNPAADCYEFPYHNPAAYPWFMGLMFAKYLGIKHATLVAGMTGIVIVVLLAYVLAVSGRTLLTGDSRRRVVVILTGYTLIYASAAAIGRVCMGMEAAQSSRNITLLIPGFVGIYFYLLASPPSLRQKLLMIVLFLAVLPSGIQRYHKEIEGFSAMKRAWKSCYLASENIQRCEQASHLPLYPNPEAIHLREKLEFLKQNRLNLYANNY